VRFHTITILIVAVSVLLMVLVPGTNGSFSSVNGPATVFRAARKALETQQALVSAGSTVFALLLAACCLLFSSFASLLTALTCNDWPECLALARRC
jgi:hypothetical protein